ncbi:MAG: sulfatase [Phycisphaerales bacterium]|nr:sulfatase [Phycisphaerales bacterium]
MRALPAALSLTCAAVFAVSGCDRPPAESAPPLVLEAGARKPNVIFIMVDTLRADRLGAYGNKGGFTPVMDALAAEGVLFERCQSAASWTLPSIASILTSYYPGVHKANDYKEVDRQRMDLKAGKDILVAALADSFATLPEILYDNGYETAACVMNPFIQAEFGFGQGFHFFFGGVLENGKGNEGSRANEQAFAWLDGKTAAPRDAAKPFFLYLHYMDCHGPYDAPARLVDPLLAAVEADTAKQPLPARAQEALLPKNYLRRTPPVGSDPTRYDRLNMYREYWLAGYNACVQEQDEYIAELIAGLKSRGLWEDALVVLVSDHGESFAEHLYWEHGLEQYQTTLHVPLVVRWPKIVPAGKRVGAAVRTMDITPTLLEMLAISKEGSFAQGVSLVKAMQGAADAPKPLVYSEAAKRDDIEIEAVVEGDWKLIVSTIRANGELAKPVELYDLKSDPGETTNVADAKQKIADAMYQKLVQQREANKSARPGVIINLKTAPDTLRGPIGVPYGGEGHQHGDSDGPATAPASQPGSQPAPTNGKTRP